MLKRKFPEARLRRYAGGGHRRVEGWLNPMDAQLIAGLGVVQTAADITGGVGEIGIHHGRLFILLYLMIHEGERAFCIDVFDDQTQNVDRSGSGNEAVFHRNLSSFADTDIDTIRKSSDDVSTEEILDAAGRIRLFSIDGGHTAELTRNDIHLAASGLADNGVVILDDYFNPQWPGVSEGALQALPASELVPFAIGRNKVFVCRSAYSAWYRERLRALFPHNLLKEALLLGAPVDIYVPRSALWKLLRQQFVDSPAWLAIRETPAGRLILKVLG